MKKKNTSNFSFVCCILIHKHYHSVSQFPPFIQNRTCCIKDQTVSNCYNECTARTCRNVKNPPQICTLQCALNVCECREGLYLNECNECVVKEMCYVDCLKSMPIKCKGSHERVYGCLKPSERRVCPNPVDIMINAITAQLTNSTIREELCILNVCDCTRGFFRNKCGKCVPLPECDNNCCNEFKCREQNTQMIPIPSMGKCGKCSKSGCHSECQDCGNDCDDDKCDDDNCDHKCKRKCKKCKRCKKHQNCPHTCACKSGYAKNKCGICVPIVDVILDVPCACTNPCTAPNQEWQCFNKCNERTCQNYYELPSKLCEASCSYGCGCSVNKNLWYNGTACVTGSMCQRPSTAPVEMQINRPKSV